MAWLGFITLITIYWCFFTAVTTGRLGWVAICIWLLPILAMTITYRAGMEINGLMVLICWGMFFICRRSLAEVRMWNIRKRKRHSVLFAVLYFVLFCLFLYSFAQAQIQGYMLNIQGWNSEHGSIWSMLLTIFPMLVFNWIFTQMVINTFDRLYCRKKDLTLLACRFYIANESGVEKGLVKGYFLEGVENGITYYFRMTRRTYYMLSREPFLRLQVKVGLLGGYYVTQLDVGQYLKRVRQSDRRDLQLGVIGGILVMAAGVWLFRIGV